MKRILLSVLVLLGAAAFLITAGGASNGAKTPEYKIELDNAFGLVTGADFKVAGVAAGQIKKIDLEPACYQGRHGGDPTKCYSLVTVSVTKKGFGSFHPDAFCQSRPQSLIGEYFIDCDPGSQGPALKPGSIIPVTHTQSTIPADLLNDIMRLPYRQRFSLIINELGAAVAGRAQDLQLALRRAVPALTETDNLLNLLSSDSSTLQRLNVDADSVITALANNSKLVQNWIVEAGRNATDTATQRTALQQTFHKLPTFLETLRPNMQQLGQAADANIPVLTNLNASSNLLSRLFTDLPGFAHSSLPALRSLGQESITGKVALNAAKPTIRDLTAYAKPSPELAQNLAIVLHDLDDRSRAVEPDPRSPGGKGYTGLEALLQYVFNQTLSINTFSEFGHLLTVDGFYNSVCSPYATPQSIADNLRKYAAGQVTTDPRTCYGFLGKNEPGVNETDPTAPSACVADPGGHPDTGPNGSFDHAYGDNVGPSTSATQCPPSSNPAGASDRPAAQRVSSTGSSSPPHSASGTSGHGSGLQGAIGQILGSLGSTVGGAVSGPTGAASGAAGAVSGAAGTATGAASTTAGTTSGGGNGGSSDGGQTQQLLNYLLAP